jgi:hypothetical protein
VLQEAATGVSNANRPGSAVDECEPELPLERRDVVGHDRLRVSELAGRLREGACSRDRMERTQAAEIIHRPTA